MRKERLSSAKKILCKCPRCHTIWLRHFMYGCYDVFPHGGYPRYFCPDCQRLTEMIHYHEVSVILGMKGGMK